MSDQVVTYAAHQNVWTWFMPFFVGWLAVYLGTLRWGRRFSGFAIVSGLLIPIVSLRPWIWRAWLDPELVAWNSAYWLAPALLVSFVAALIRRARRVAA